MLRRGKEEQGELDLEFSFDFTVQRHDNVQHTRVPLMELILPIVSMVLQEPRKFHFIIPPPAESREQHHLL